MLPDYSFTMLRGDLAAIPQYTLPAEYRFRLYQPGDGAAWRALHLAAEPFITVTEDFFEREFGDHVDALPDRMFFVEAADGTIAGTITAWWEQVRENPGGRGRIHWVAVHPAHQRRGLTKSMMTVAMERLAQSHTSALLGTSSGRPWAVKVYLDFGFRPEPSELADPQVYAAWTAVQSVLHHPALTSFGV
jgi:GNAT superfamily N-acetyltransferase